MDKRTINIAVIVSGINEEYQNTVLKGIHEYSSQHNINVYHFISYGGNMKNKNNDVGEFNIFELVNYSEFDGVILLTNTITSTEITEKIVEKVKAAGIPAVSVDNDLSDIFYYVGIDNYTAMRDMVEHIVKFHKIKRINYISGSDDNPESLLRTEAYLDVLKDNNIPIEEERIYHGSFIGEDGRDAINKFLSSDAVFPEAIICGNDAMALSAVIELEKYGINVPDDVLITGFDSIYAARNYAPEISTVKRPLKRSGVLACKLILDHINGIRNDRVNVLNTESCFSESCGCPDNMKDEISKFKKSNYRTMEALNIYTPMINRISCELEECQSIDDIAEVLKGFIRELRCGKFFFCLCDGWDADDGIDGGFTVHGYTEMVTPVVSYVDGKFAECKKFPSEEMLPDICDSSSLGDNYYFAPVHFRDHCFGYCMICNSPFPMESIGLFHTWIMSISNSIENIRKIICLDRMLKMLDHISITDPLVQIYNRNGLNNMSEPIYQECIRKKKDVMIMFIDMDDLKKINDKFGHEEGDFSLQAIADAIKHATNPHERQIPARFGGDEFIIFAPDTTEEEAQRMETEITQYLDNVNKTSGKPYEIRVSAGYFVTKADPSLSINKLISAADKIMYENKKRKKLSRMT